MAEYNSSSNYRIRAERWERFETRDSSGWVIERSSLKIGKKKGKTGQYPGELGVSECIGSVTTVSPSKRNRRRLHRVNSANQNDLPSNKVTAGGGSQVHRAADLFRPNNPKLYGTLEAGHASVFREISKMGRATSATERERERERGQTHPVVVRTYLFARVDHKNAK